MFLDITREMAQAQNRLDQTVVIISGLIGVVNLDWNLRSLLPDLFNHGFNHLKGCSSIGTTHIGHRKICSSTKIHFTQGLLDQRDRSIDHIRCASGGQ